MGENLELLPREEGTFTGGSGVFYHDFTVLKVI